MHHSFQGAGFKRQGQKTAVCFHLLFHIIYKLDAGSFLLLFGSDKSVQFSPPLKRTLIEKEIINCQNHILLCPPQIQKSEDSLYIETKRLVWGNPNLNILFQLFTRGQYHGEESGKHLLNQLHVCLKG